MRNQQSGLTARSQLMSMLRLPWAAPFFALSLAVPLAGCGSSEDPAAAEKAKHTNCAVGAMLRAAQPPTSI